MLHNFSKNKYSPKYLLDEVKKDLLGKKSTEIEKLQLFRLSKPQVRLREMIKIHGALGQQSHLRNHKKKIFGTVRDVRHGALFIWEMP
eukprot:snap_masked-scaffold_29-processed-gene-1.36-mRNA-1 protein AED:1.00 eAED:1.00 QI:0/0/0/0/1/1/2/0/87